MVKPLFGFLPPIEPSLKIEGMKRGPARTLRYYAAFLMAIRIERDKNREIDIRRQAATSIERTKTGYLATRAN